jgi:hypothetical protein
LALYYRVAELVKDGKTRDQIIYEMGLKGVRRDTVERMLERLAQSQRSVQRQQGWRHLALGGAITLMALGLTFGLFGFAPANALAIFPTLVGLGIGGYWIVRGVFEVVGW